MKKYTSAIALIMSAILLVGSLLAVSASATETSYQSLDFADPAAAENREISPSELLSMMIGESVSRAEAEYLDTYSTHILSVTDGFSNDTVSLLFSDGTLTVTAAVYSYRSLGGAEVKWIPEHVEIDGRRLPLSSNDGAIYTAKVNGLSQSEGLRAYVRYSCTLSISKDIANSLINLAFRDATEAVRLEEEYRAVLGEYLESYRKYEKYLEDSEIYEEDLEKYNEYLVLKAEYEKDKTAYEKYLVALADYNDKLKSYNDYLDEYNSYLDAKDEYDRNYAENTALVDKYIQYCNELNRVRSSMYAVESIFTRPDSGHNTLFGALQNKEMINLFNKYKDLLKMYGISAAKIDQLSNFADELNELLKEYSKARNISEQAAFAFYCANYVEMRDKFNYLYNSMVEIMTPTLFNHMCLKIDTIDYKNDPERAQYIKHRALMVLAQTYLVCKCLDDSSSADGSWSFYNYSGKKHTYAFGDLISQNVIIIDTNSASPAGLVWPTEVPKYELPPVPQEPTAVAKPLEPLEVDEPDEPAEVTEPTRPTEVAHPGKAPSGLEDLLKTTAIVDALSTGELSSREELATDPTIVLTHTTSKLVSFENKPVMTVYGYDMSTPLLERVISSASDISVPDEEPVREPDKKQVYTFVGWSLSRSELIPPTGENTPDGAQDFCIYAIYSAEKKLYTVTWVTASGEFSETYYYGSIPSFKGDTAKESDATTVYTFERWSPTPSMVTKDEIYTAQYSSTERKYSVSWILPEKTVTKNYSYNDIPDQPSFNKTYISGLSRFEFTSWDKTVTKVSESVTYTAIFKETVLASSDSGKAELTVSSGAYSLTLPDSSFEIGELIRLAAAENKRIEISANGINIAIDRDTVKMLSLFGASDFSVNADTASISSAGATLTVTDKEGAQIICDREMRISIPFSLAVNNNFHVYSVISGGARIDTPYAIDDGKISFSAKANSTFVFKQLYSVTLSTDENGEAMLDRYVCEAGEKLKLSLYPATGYTGGAITVTRSDDGSVITLESLDELIMPESDITISISFEKLSYTVSFVWNGEVISTEKCPIGEIPTPPKMDLEYEEDGYRYVFMGWSPAVQSITKDTTYTAKYSKYLIDVAPPEDVGSAMDGFIENTVLPAVSILIFAGSLIFALVVVIRIKVKSKRAKKK
ncbi:MAG: hypothetical protein J6Q77_01330 [Clostridia bacterium]|nr:hypothetical protein [Clostridia bacterium]